MTDFNKQEPPGNQRPSLRAIAKIAYGGPLRDIGIFIAAVSLFNLYLAAFRMSPAQYLDTLVAAYQYIFHSIVEVLTFWWPWPLSPIVKDVIVLWTLMGTTIMRWTRVAGLHNRPHSHTIWWRIYAVLYYVYFPVITMLLGPLLLVIYFFAHDPVKVFSNLYLNRPRKVKYGPMFLLMSIKEPQYDKGFNALVLLMMFGATLAACATLIAINAFFGHPGAVPSR